MTCLVTGYKGFIGSKVYNHLKTFTNIVIDGFGRSDELPTAQYDVVIHCAGSTPSTINNEFKYIEDNINLTKKILDKYSNSKIIYLSTKDIYGNPTTDVITESTIPYKQSFYGMSKYLAEKLIIGNAKQYIILRLPAVIGVNSPSTFITRMVDNIVNNKENIIYNGDRKFNSVIHIDNIVSVLEYMINTDISNEIYNVSSKKPIYLKEIPILISQKLNMKNLKLQYISNSDYSSLFSSSKIQKIINMDSVSESITKYIRDLING